MSQRFRYLQVAAYTDGRSNISLQDCLLLQHIFWQKPDEAERIADFVLSQLASDEKNMLQADYLFKGTSGGAAASMANLIRESLAGVGSSVHLNDMWPCRRHVRQGMSSHLDEGANRRTAWRSSGDA